MTGVVGVDVVFISVIVVATTHVGISTRAGMAVFVCDMMVTRLHESCRRRR